MKTGLLTRPLLVAALLFSSAVLAQAPATRADLESQKATLLSKADLEALLPGATNENIAPRSGSTRSWSLAQGGRLTGRATGGLNQNYTKAEGKWNIDDDGKYCVNVDWTWGGGASTEKWCAAVYKLGADYYAVTRNGADAVAWKQKISK